MRNAKKVAYCIISMFLIDVANNAFYLLETNYQVSTEIETNSIKSLLIIAVAKKEKN